jgi:2'-5' RNA ligase
MMVALYLPPSVAGQMGFTTRDNTAVADLHVTLTHVEEPTDQEERVTLQVVREFAAAHPPIPAVISGHGRFFASASDGKDIWYASVDSDPLTRFHFRLVTRLEEAGVAVSRDHGFSPHITLAFLAHDEPTPYDRGPRKQIPLVFDAVAVKRAEGQPALVPLAG